MSRLLKLACRRSFLAKFLALAAMPFAAKVAVALPVEAPSVRGGTEAATIDLAEASALARAWIKGRFRIEPYRPTCGVYDHHPPSDYFFFFVDRDELYIGASETIAVRKSDGRVTHCGWVGE